MKLALDRGRRRLSDVSGRRFDPTTRTWIADTVRGELHVAARDAVSWLQRESGAPLREPIGVIGPRAAAGSQLAAAEAIGGGLARMGLAVICGGRQGVMEAVAKGAAEAGGTAIGLLPEADAREANRYLTFAIATGIGEARNALIARASFCLIAIGDSYGTLSEVALGLQFGKCVFGLDRAARLDGVRHCLDPDEALDRVALHVLGL